MIKPILPVLIAALFVTAKPFAQNPFDYSSPSEKGFSAEKLDSLGLFLEEAGSSALMILVDGEIIYEWGQTEEKLLVHSIRKALLNALYGIYIGNGTIDTSLTLKELEIDDIPPALSELEKSATIADLLKSRSGIYHDAAAVTAGMLRNMPERGAHQPNETFFYNNWDFNALGFILEQLTGAKIYDLFYKHIAQPLGMNYENQYITVTNPEEDWEIPDVDGIYKYETEKSKFPAYHFRLSARDLALYGQLFLNQGNWKGEQIIPKEWITISTKPYSVTNEKYGLGYGMLWKILIPTANRQSKSFYHTGVGIHMLGIYPASNLVLVHRVNTEQDFDFNEGHFYQMIAKVWGAQIK